MLPSIPQDSAEDVILREGRLAQDVSLLRSELAYVRASEAQLRSQLSSAQEELNGVRLELSTALAAAQIRVEQLQNTVQDMRYDATEARQERTQLRAQLDAARDAYLEAQRAAREASQDAGQLRQEVVSLKADAQANIQQLKHAMHGAAAVLSNHANLDAALDALVDAGKGTDQRSFLLAKIAVLSKESEAWKEKATLAETENAALHSQLARYSDRFRAAGAGAGTGVQLLYEELELRDDETKRLRDALQAEAMAAATAKQRMTAAEHKAQKAAQQVAKYKKAMKEVAALRAVVRGMIQQDVEGDSDEQ